MRLICWLANGCGIIKYRKNSVRLTHLSYAGFATTRMTYTDSPYNNVKQPNNLQATLSRSLSSSRILLLCLQGSDGNQNLLTQPIYCPYLKQDTIVWIPDGYNKQIQFNMAASLYSFTHLLHKVHKALVFHCSPYL